MTNLVQQPFAGHEVLSLNSTPMERAMADVSADFMLSLDIPISTLWNPWECPEPYLPFLAWALSVDLWDSDWPLDVKRRVIAASPMIHRRKGTLWAVEEALKSVGISTKITEWWETNPPKRRGTFEVLALVNEQIYDGSGVIIDERVQKLAFAAVKASKPKSRVFDLRIGAELNQEFSVACAADTGLEHGQYDACTDLNTDGQSGTGLALTATAISHSQISGCTEINTDQRAEIGVSMTATTVQYAQIIMETI